MERWFVRWPSIRTKDCGWTSFALTTLRRSRIQWKWCGKVLCCLAPHPGGPCTSEEFCGVARQNLGGRGDIQCATLENAHLNPGFDGLTLWNLLEHVPDPKGFLVECRNLLGKSGYRF